MTILLRRKGETIPASGKVAHEVRTTYQRLKKRYGPSYTRAMVGGVFVALLLPLPGSTFLVAGLIVAIAELHRAISQRGGFGKYMIQSRRTD